MTRRNCSLWVRDILREILLALRGLIIFIKTLITARKMVLKVLKVLRALEILEAFLEVDLVFIAIIKYCP